MIFIINIPFNDGQKLTDSNILNIKEFILVTSNIIIHIILVNLEFDGVSSWDDYGNGMKIIFMDGSEELLTKKDMSN